MSEVEALKYNYWTVIKNVDNGKVLARCQCGRERVVSLSNLKEGRSKSCGCWPRGYRTPDPTGEKYGRLLIISRLNNKKVLVKCDCGCVKEVYLYSLKNGMIKSCGCFNVERLTKHGMCKEELYTVWEGILQRCYNNNHQSYHCYGGRGVTVCDEWRSDFKAFYDWAIANGWKKGLKIDKDIKATNGSGLIYSPVFCSIVTQKQNLRCTSQSRIIVYNNKSLCLAEWAEKLNMPYITLRSRLNRGWPIERAFFEPINKRA